MWFDILLLSTLALAVVAVWMWPPPLRRTTAFFMMVAAGLLALVCWLSVQAQAPGPWRMLGWAAICAVLLMRVVAPLARRLAFAAMEREWTWLASVGVEVFVALQPGLGGERDRAMVRAYRRAISGNIDAELANLDRAKRNVPRTLHVAIDANQIWLLLLARRHRDAVALAEASFADVPSGQGEAATLTMPLELRLQLLGALAALGEDVKLAGHAKLILEAARDVPALTKLHRYTAMVVLAAAGRVATVEAWAASLGNTTTKYVRAYWRAVAAIRSGDAAMAVAAVARVQQVATTKRQRESAALLASEFSRSPAAPMAPALVALADELTAEVAPVALRASRTIATYALMAVMAAWAAAIAWALRGSLDTGSLVRGGAGVKHLVAGGEWWRLLTASFVHVGAAHLAINALSLWSVGRIVERLIGSWRMAAVFLFAALSGAACSHLLRETQVAAGASGGVMGLLGALLVEVKFRKAHAQARGISAKALPVLYFVVAVQVLSDALVPAADGVAHLAGLLGGAGFALAFGARDGLLDRAVRGSQLVVLALTFATLAGAWLLFTHGPATWLAASAGDDRSAAYAALGIDAQVDQRVDISDEAAFVAWTAREATRLQDVVDRRALVLPADPTLWLRGETGRVASEQLGDHVVVIWFAQRAPSEGAAATRVGRLVLPRVYLTDAWPQLVAWMNSSR
ncbi:MAG: rhomboid family intramembrane serine protease [Myxococcales bacterium]|nr:rhomboid family intramembrane serine protease [Myxococcales bacterium]